MDEYLDLLSSVISEKEFVTDYDQFYPIKSDLYILSTLCPDPYPFFFSVNMIIMIIEIIYYKIFL